MALEKIVYTAHGSATGGRNGHAESSDGAVRLDLTVPKEMGGAGKAGATNPEQLFACGYAACFGGATEFVARTKKIEHGPIHVAADVGIGPRVGGGFGIQVALKVKIPGVPHETAVALANEAHEKVCPYSHATRGNVDVKVDVLKA
jgi:Ohr subfamily peroxiredoxin